MKHTALKIYLLFAAVVVGTYGQILFFNLLWFDDLEHLCRNTALNPVHAKSLLDIWQSPYFGLYTPVTYTLWSLPMGLSQFFASADYNCFNAAPWMHGLSLLLHLGNVFLVYQLLKKMISAENLLIPALGALLFAVHPLQVESVAWVSSTRDLLSAFFGFYACLLCLRGRLKLALVLLALSMLSKPTGVIFAALAALLIWNQDRELLKTRWKFISVSLLLGLAVTWITKTAQPDNALSFDVPLFERPLFYAQAIGFYLWKIFLPWPLAPDYGRSAPAILQDPSMLLLGLVVIPLAIAVWRYHKTLLVPALWLVIAILPVSGLVNFGFEEISTVADRYAYVTLFAVSLALCQFRVDKWKMGVTALILVLLGIKSIFQGSVWTDDKTLFRHNISINPKSSLSYSNLGNALFHEGNYAEAEPNFIKSIKLNPKESQAWLSLARSQSSLGREKEAEATYRKSIELGVALPQTYNNLGAIFAGASNFEEAEKYWIEAFRLNPKYMEAIYNLGILYLNQKKYESAAKAFEKATEIAPNDPRPRQQLELAKKQL